MKTWFVNEKRVLNCKFDTKICDELIENSIYLFDNMPVKFIGTFLNETIDKEVLLFVPLELKDGKVIEENSFEESHLYVYSCLKNYYKELKHLYSLNNEIFEDKVYTLVHIKFDKDFGLNMHKSFYSIELKNTENVSNLICAVQTERTRYITKHRGEIAKEKIFITPSTDHYYFNKNMVLKVLQPKDCWEIVDFLKSLGPKRKTETLPDSPLLKELYQIYKENSMCETIDDFIRLLGNKYYTFTANTIKRNKGIIILHKLETEREIKHNDNDNLAYCPYPYVQSYELIDF